MVALQSFVSCWCYSFMLILAQKAELFFFFSDLMNHFSGFQAVKEKTWWKLADTSHNSFWEESQGDFFLYVFKNPANLVSSFRFDSLCFSHLFTPCLYLMNTRSLVRMKLAIYVRVNSSISFADTYFEKEYRPIFWLCMGWEWGILFYVLCFYLFITSSFCMHNTHNFPSINICAHEHMVGSC